MRFPSCRRRLGPGSKPHDRGSAAVTAPVASHPQPELDYGQGPESARVEREEITNVWNNDAAAIIGMVVGAVIGPMPNDRTTRPGRIRRAKLPRAQTTAFASGCTTMSPAPANNAKSKGLNIATLGNLTTLADAD